LTAHRSAALPALSAARSPADRLVNAILFLMVLVSAFVRFEPAPYEGLFALLALACFAANVPIDRKLSPLIALLAVWNVSGLVSLAQVSHDQAAVTFMAVSVYLAISAILLACVFSDDTVWRIELMKRAYVAAAVIVVALGLAGYFLYAGEDALTGRVRGTFKDPNVFGPFLILPILLLATDLFQRGFSLWRILVITFLLFGLLMSFSRGAWLNFAASGIALTALLFLTAPTPRMRIQLIAMSLVALMMLAAVVAAALSIDAVGNMFEERAKVTQSYDTGDRGRFTSQASAILIILDHPNGVGPFQLRHHTGIDPHQVYLNAFASYGWVGGVAYIAMILGTLFVGFRYVIVRTPWQPALVATYAAFVGTVVEGMVIDTDHWRHFYLMLGLIWGLAVATQNAMTARARPAT
jgi:O-antigen ligase